MITELSDTGSLDTLIEDLEPTKEGEKFRLSLLHENRGNLYLFLSGNAEELRGNVEIPIGLTIAVSNNLEIDVLHDVIFHKRHLENDYYFVMKYQGVPEKREEVLPFRYHSEIPSTIVSAYFKERLLEYLSSKSNTRLKLIEDAGEKGTFRAVFERLSSSSPYKKQIEEEKDLMKRVKHELRELFSYEASPSDFLYPPDFHPEDIHKEVRFARKSLFGSTLRAPCLMMCLAVTPYSVIDYCVDSIKRQGQQNYLKRELTVVDFLGEYFLYNPRAEKGIKRMVGDAKHIANVATYGLEACAAALASSALWTVLSYPIIAYTIADGLTMVGDTIVSKGKDSSGIISTVLNNMFFRQLE